MRLIGVLVALYALYCAAGYVLQRRMLFAGAHLQPLREVDPDTMPGVKRIWLMNGAGESEAWFLPPPELGDSGARPTIIFHHGNAEFIDDWASLLPDVRRLGVGLLLLEYPGYGRSTGAPSERSVTAAAVAAFDWLQSEAGVQPDRIVAMGRSLGGGAALALSRHRPVAGIIVQSTFTGVGALARSAYLLPPFLARDPFDNLGALKAFDGPVLVLHGRKDRMIPFHHGERLAAASDKARLVAMTCAHNDCPPSWAEFWTVIRAFLVEEGLLGSGPASPGGEGE